MQSPKCDPKDLKVFPEINCIINAAQIDKEKYTQIKSEAEKLMCEKSFVIVFYFCTKSGVGGPVGWYLGQSLDYQ